VLDVPTGRPVDEAARGRRIGGGVDRRVCAVGVERRDRLRQVVDVGKGRVDVAAMSAAVSAATIAARPCA